MMERLWRANFRDKAESFDTGGSRIAVHAPTVHVVGLAVLTLVPGLLVCLVIEWASTSSHDEGSLLLALLAAVLFGGLCKALTTASDSIPTSSIFSAVAFSWICCSLVGALPYAAGSMFGWSRFDFALFEAVSGFSATGSTVLDDIEQHGAGILMWRQVTQFYGGMGMVVLAVSVLPLLGVGGLSLMSAEAPGPTSDRLVPRVSETARTLWTLYIGVTLVIAGLLWAAPGPGLYDAFAHALTTASTGGFSPYNRSVGHFDSPLVEAIIIAGLFICGMNFTLHYRATRGNLRSYPRSTETRAYVMILVGATGVATLVNWSSKLVDNSGGSVDVGLLGAFRDSVFNVVTLGSSGGFSNARGADSLGNYAIWNPGLQVMLLAIMVIGGCAGSTAGGAKVFRAQISFRHGVRALHRLRHPSAVLPVRLGRATLEVAVLRRVLGFLMTFLAVIIVSTAAVAATGAEIFEALTASVSAISNMGPAMGEAGPTSNFLVFTRPARVVLMVVMLIGRLELFAVLLMFATPLRSVRRWQASRGN